MKESTLLIIFVVASLFTGHVSAIGIYGNSGFFHLIGASAAAYITCKIAANVMCRDTCFNHAAEADCDTDDKCSWYAATTTCMCDKLI